MKSNNHIFLDFEGLIDQPPSMAGALVGEKFLQFTLIDDLQGGANAEHVLHMQLSEFLEFILKYAKTKNCLIVGFTNRELDVFLERGFSDAEKYYYNAHKALKKWFNKNHYQDRPRPFALKAILEFWDYPLKSYGQRQTTQRIEHVRKQLIRNEQDFSQLTAVAKQKWTKVLNYNKQDVLGLKFAMDKAGLLS